MKRSNEAEKVGRKTLAQKGRGGERFGIVTVAIRSLLVGVQLIVLFNCSGLILLVLSTIESILFRGVTSDELSTE